MAVTLKDFIASRMSLDVSLVGRLIDRLMNVEILVSKLDQESAEIQDLQRQWRSHDWVQAADYHIVTLDYEFIDYSVDGPEVDYSRMKSYSQLESDINRGKSYATPARVPGRRPSKEAVDAPFNDAWNRTVRARSVTRQSLMDILSLVFGKTGEIRLHWAEKSPAMLKTSPSGGARHPTEAYVTILEVKGLERGWYHFNPETYELELLNPTVEQSELSTIFPGAYKRAPFNPVALVTLTCVFERNMYRYREPRTFRSIHMDAGHLATSLEIACAGRGLRTFTHYGVKESHFEQILTLNFLEESPMLAVAIGSSEGGL